MAQLKVELPDSDVVKQFDRLWELAKAYGFEDWIQFDASVVRGLAYYTGIVFEGFDKAGVLRAICGGGRYNRLLTTYGAKQDIPAAGFGFGDCVIVELLKEKNLLPELLPTLDDIVIPFNEDLRPAACQVAAKLREQGRSVDVILNTNKKIPWYEQSLIPVDSCRCYNYADRVSAKRAVLIAPDEWARGEVRIKDLRKGGKDDTSKEVNIQFSEL